MCYASTLKDLKYLPGSHTTSERLTFLFIFITKKVRVQQEVILVIRSGEKKEKCLLVHENMSRLVSVENNGLIVQYH